MHFRRPSNRILTSVSVTKDLSVGKLFPLPSTRENLQKRINTYNSFSREEIHKILTELIQIKKFKQLVCKSLQLQYLYHPIISILQEEYQWAGEKVKINQLIEILIQGRFFRKLPKETFAFFVNNMKSTETNVACIIAGMLVTVSGRLNMSEIQRILKVFEFEEKLCQTQFSGLTLQYQKILKVLKKLERKVKPIDFKQWIEDFKKSTNSQRIENFHFLYLVSLTQQKKDQISGNFMDFNLSKDKRGKTQSIILQHGDDATEGDKKEQKNQNQKYRMKSFSYSKDTCTLPSVVAFTCIKTNIHETQEKLKDKRKSLTLLNRIKTTYEKTPIPQLVFKQIPFPENKIHVSLGGLKVNNQRNFNSTGRKSRAFSSNSSVVSKALTAQESKKSTKNKQNLNLPCQKYQQQIKQKLVINFPQQNQKKLVLNKDQQRINNNFAKILNYHEKKIENETRYLSAYTRE